MTARHAARRTGRTAGEWEEPAHAPSPGRQSGARAQPLNYAAIAGEKGKDAVRPAPWLRLRLPCKRAAPPSPALERGCGTRAGWGGSVAAAQAPWREAASPVCCAALGCSQAWPRPLGAATQTPPRPEARVEPPHLGEAGACSPPLPLPPSVSTKA